MEKARIKIRVADERDLNFVLSSWLKSFKANGLLSKRIKNTVYYQFHHALVKRLLQTAKVLVAADQVDDSVIYGWVAHDSVSLSENATEASILHYTYVKSAFRDMGIAKMLWEKAGLYRNPTFFTHFTFACDNLMSKWPELTYCPYLV